MDLGLPRLFRPPPRFLRLKRDLHGELPLDAAQLKGMTSVARLLLNLDETITKS